MGEKDRSCETLEMGTGKSSFRQTFGAHGHRSHCIIHGRAAFSITGSLLGSDRNLRSDAINAGRDIGNFS
jgi:hypothetical protein